MTLFSFYLRGSHQRDEQWIPSIYQHEAKQLKLRSQNVCKALDQQTFGKVYKTLSSLHKACWTTHLEACSQSLLFTKRWKTHPEKGLVACSGQRRPHGRSLPSTARDGRTLGATTSWETAASAKNNSDHPKQFSHANRMFPTFL